MPNMPKKVAISSRGSKPGERRGGRIKGVPNKATADIKALAQEYSANAMKRLYQIATESESDAASVAAIKELFDRGYGKAKQAVEHSGPDGEAIQIEQRVREDATVVSSAVAGLASRLRASGVAGTTHA